jgi:divalent metal cation (Fe/Co/Zn/Cd) transporter
MPRWKALAQLIGGALMVAAGAWLGAEASDIMPVFKIDNWVALILALLIMWRGWDIVHDAWDAL